MLPSPDLALALEHLPDPFFALDHSLRFVQANRAALEVVAVPLEALMGQRFQDAFAPAVGTPFEAAVLRAQGGEVVDFEAYWSPLEAWLRVRCIPLPSGVGVHYRVVSAEKREAESREKLLATLSRLTQARTPDAVVQTILEAVLAGTGAFGGAVYRLEAEHGRLRLEGAVGYAPELLEQFRSVALDAPVPLAEAISQQKPLFLNTEAYMARISEAGRLSQTRTAIAIPLLGVAGVLGGLTLSFGERADFDALERDFVLALGRQCALALERAILNQQTQTDAELQAQTRALEAFVRFTELAGSETDPDRLAERAVETLRQTLGHEVSLGFYQFEADSGRWRATVRSSDIDDAVWQKVQAGLPEDPSLATQSTRRGDLWLLEDFSRLSAPYQELLSGYRATATAPLTVQGELRAILSLGHRSQSRWSERDVAVIQAVARSLTLALERGDLLTRLEAQNALLKQREAALEAFSLLGRDLAFETRETALVLRAQEIVLELLPPGVALYYELEGETWQVRAQAGLPLDPQLQAAIDRGLPFELTTNLKIPWESGEAYYQEVYQLGTDALDTLAEGVGATATLPLLVEGQRRGVLAVVLFGHHRWGALERGVLGTAVHQLGLALTRSSAARRLLEKTEEAQRISAELDAFAYSISHDLRTPVRQIGSFAGLLRKRLPDLEARPSQMLEQIERSSNDLNAMIEGLLAFSRLGSTPLSTRTVDLDALARSVIARLVVGLEEPRPRFTLSDLPEVQGDPLLLERVFENLLSNALKYSRGPGPRRVELGATLEGDRVRVQVRDYGVGFDPSQSERLFGVFSRLHAPSEFEGTGVGLALVRRIVEKHGGEVWAESHLGQGATFGFWLPR